MKGHPCKKLPDEPFTKQIFTVNVLVCLSKLHSMRALYRKTFTVDVLVFLNEFHIMQTFYKVDIDHKCALLSQ